MKSAASTALPRRCRQRGAVLIFSLLMLLVLTLLGVTGVGNSLLEERMSGNFFQTYTAMQAAETALRVAEDWLSRNVTPAHLLPPGDESYDPAKNWFGNAPAAKKGLYSTRPVPGLYTTCQGKATEDCIFIPTDEGHWCSPGCEELPRGYVELGSAEALGTALAGIDDGLVSRQPRFIIEYLGRGLGREPNMVMGAAVRAPDARKHAFRITAIGWGLDASSHYVLQSHFQL